jgi:hypothetical protein
VYANRIPAAPDWRLVDSHVELIGRSVSVLPSRSWSSQKRRPYWISVLVATPYCRSPIAALSALGRSGVKVTARSAGSGTATTQRGSWSLPPWIRKASTPESKRFSVNFVVWA